MLILVFVVYILTTLGGMLLNGSITMAYKCQLDIVPHISNVKMILNTNMKQKKYMSTAQHSDFGLIVYDVTA